jgi:hypothetical protein
MAQLVRLHVRARKAKHQSGHQLQLCRMHHLTLGSFKRERHNVRVLAIVEGENHVLAINRSRIWRGYQSIIDPPASMFLETDHSARADYARA